MKKKLLGTLTALFLFALLLPAAARATDAHAVLYDDGTLVFQQDDTPQDGKTVRQTYDVDLTGSYASESSLPWYNERQAVFVVDFAATVRPASTRNWFSGFTNLEYVHGLRNLDTSGDTDMSGMFGGCGSLRELDLSGFDTASVTDMSGMFRDCTRLMSLNLSAFDTSGVTDMSGMFARCTALKEVDLSSFDTASLESAASMFEACSSLRTVYASDRFDAAPVQSGEKMFEDCRALVGGNGTRFDSQHTDKSYARLDADDAPGYFSVKSGPVSGEAFAVLYSDGSFVFQYGDMAASGKTVVKTYRVDLTGSYNTAASVPWRDELEDIRVVSFDDTIRPNSTAFWFAGASGLERVEHLERLNTREAASMFSMFRGCSGLTELDVSRFQTANVVRMSRMFEGCSGLTTLDLSGFDTRNVLELYDMFRGCSSLRTLYASAGFDVPESVSGSDMFADCTSLAGGNGTRFDREHVDEEYARIDTAAAPGYFSSREPVPHYTVTWENEDGTVLQTEEVAAGVTPVYSGDAPIKTGHAFVGWEPEPAPLSADTAYTARFTPAVCTVTWADEDGTVLQTQEVASGTVPTYGGETPAKPEHAFAGWRPEPAPVVVDTTYTARFRRVGPPLDVGADAYSFANSRDGFGYTASECPISPNSVFVIFGNGMFGRVQYSRIASAAWSGNCAGMAGSAALFYADETVNPADFGEDNVWALETTDSNDEMTVLRFIEAMQVAQYTEAFARARQEHAFRPGESLIPLVEAVRDAAQSACPTLIAVTKQGIGGHALLAFGVEDESDTGARLKIYDCNSPGELQYLTVQNTSAWSYDMGEYGVWGGDGCSISYVPFETLESIWENRGSPRGASETLTVNVGNLSITDALGEEVAALVDGRLVTGRDDVYEMPELSMYWPEERTIFLPTGVYTLTSGDDTELTATMTDRHMSASITTTAGTVSFAVDDDTMTNTVTVVDAAETDTYSITLESDLENMLCQNVSLEGTGQGKTLEISINQDGSPLVSNAGGASLTIDDVPQTTYTITASAGEGGTVTPAGNMTVPAGANRTFNFMPDAGYIVRSVSVDNMEIGARPNYTFRNVTGNHALSVLFAQSPLSAARVGNALRVTVANPDGQTVVVSYFDEAGKFVSADLRPAAASLTFPTVAAHTARVTLLDDAYRPLCAPVPVALT